MIFKHKAMSELKKMDSFEKYAGSINKMYHIFG